MTVTTPVAAQLFSLHDDSPNLVALFDASDQLQYGNPAFRGAYGLSANEEITWIDLIRKSHATGVGASIQARDVESWLAPVRSRRGKLPFRAFEADLCDGRWIWMTETVRADGWMLCIGNDISAIKASDRSVRQARDVAIRAAQTDGLTGISNRAHIMEQLEQRLEQLRTRQQSCGIVLLDLDHFKRVNDTYGHHTGDTVLRHFATTVRETLRRDDGFGRLGGEEFMLLFPNIEQAELERIVLRILGLVGASRPLPDHPLFDYTCSAGIGVLQPHEAIDGAYCRVDKALYEAKVAGRNRALWAPLSAP